MADKDGPPGGGPSGPGPGQGQGPPGNFDDFQYPNDNFGDFNDDQMVHQGGPPFRGRGGWQRPNRGRGPFDGGFGHRGMPRFPRGRGFMNNMRGGPGGPRAGPPGFMQRGRFGGPRPMHPDGPWQNNGPHHPQMGPGPGPMPGPGGMPGPGPGPSGNNGDEQIWAETRTGDGKSYFYHTVTRETTWERPEGPNVRIVRHDEWSTNGGAKGNSNGENFGNAGPPGTGSSGPDNQPGQPPQNMGPMSHGPGPGPGGPPFLGHGPPNRPMMGPPSGQGPPFNMPNMPPAHLQGPPGQIHGPPPGQIPGQPQPGPMQNAPNQGGSHGPTPVPVRPMQNMPNNSAPPFAPPGQFRPPGPGFPPGENNAGPPPDPAKLGSDPNLNNMQMPNPMSQPPGFPPFGPMGSPPFGMPPPTGFPQNFAMVPPPWTNMAGVPPPTGVPPPILPLDPAVPQIDPKILSQAYEWTEHIAPDGKPYFFNTKTQVSVWEKPQILKEFEAAKGIIQQRIATQPTMNPLKEKSDKLESGGEQSKLKEQKKLEAKKSGAGEKCRPISSTPVSGTPWCVVWTGDKRVFFYNPSNKQSVWERPAELVGRSDVDEMVKNAPDGKLSKVKKAEATSTTSPASEADKIAAIEASKSETKDKPKEIGEKDETTEPPAKKVKREGNEIEGITKSVTTVIEISDGPPGETLLVDLAMDDTSNDGIITSKTEDEKTRIETKDALKDANALEAEVKAARERATIPIECRLQQFREMLVEKQVSAFSTWEKELHKIVFDPRYLLLTSKERKTAFENYVKERAEEEKREKKSRMKHVKEQFMIFLEQVSVGQRMTYNEFSQKHGRHEMYKMVEKARDRELYFAEYVTDLKRKDKEDRAQKKEKAKEDFLDVLRRDVKDYHLKWSDVKKKFDIDSRYDVIELEEREELFRIFQKKLRSETRAREKKKKRENKEKRRKEAEKRELEKAKKKERQESVGSSADKLEDIDDDEDEGEADDDKDKSPDKDNDSSIDKMEEISEEEEGCITDDSDEDVRLEREKKERAEVSMREREKEVQRTLATHLRDRDKEREYYRHEEAVQEFQALLTDLVRNVEVSWKDAKKNIKKDRRWTSVSILSRDEMEDLFNQHCDTISRKKKQRFRELLQDARVKLTSTWKDIRKKIKDDTRYLKFSTSERKCEREFELYLKDMSSAMKSDFRELLKETKMLTYKTKHQVRENSYIMKDIESLLSKDKRYLQLESMPDERRRLLIEFLDDLERKGPPPPPTASEPSRRWTEASK